MSDAIGEIVCCLCCFLCEATKLSDSFWGCCCKLCKCGDCDCCNIEFEDQKDQNKRKRTHPGHNYTQPMDPDPEWGPMSPSALQNIMDEENERRRRRERQPVTTQSDVAGHPDYGSTTLPTQPEDKQDPPYIPSDNPGKIPPPSYNTVMGNLPVYSVKNNSVLTDTAQIHAQRPEPYSFNSGYQSGAHADTSLHPVPSTSV